MSPRLAASDKSPYVAARLRIPCSLEERLQATEHVAHVCCLAGRVTTETIQSACSSWACSLRERLHRRIAQLAGTHLRRVERGEREGTGDQPGRSGHDVIAPDVARDQNASNAVVDRDDFAVGGGRGFQRVGLNIRSGAPGFVPDDVVGADRRRRRFGSDVGAAHDRVSQVEGSGGARGREQPCSGGIEGSRRRAAPGIPVRVSIIRRIAQMLERSPDHLGMPCGAADHMDADERDRGRARRQPLLASSTWNFSAYLATRYEIDKGLPKSMAERSGAQYPRPTAAQIRELRPLRGLKSLADHASTLATDKGSYASDRPFPPREQHLTAERGHCRGCPARERTPAGRRRAATGGGLDISATCDLARSLLIRLSAPRRASGALRIWT